MGLELKTKTESDFSLADIVNASADFCTEPAGEEEDLNLQPD